MSDNPLRAVYRRHRGPFILPANPTPAGYRCRQLWMPDDDDFMALAAGALMELTKWNTYVMDGSTSAADTAQSWRNAFDEHPLFDTCGGGVTIQFRQTDCLLEYSLDSGVTWDTAYVGDDCINARIADGTILGGSAIDDAIANGKLSPGQQQGPTTTPALGFCKDFFVTLSANQKWICPVSIKGNYVLTIEQCKGGWTPDPTHYWYCPSGETYSFGGCAAGTGATDSGDPINTVNHMRLVGNYGTTWFDAFNTTYVVPDSVTTDQQLYLQANDSDITNNLGSVTFHITVCQADWEHVFDFTVSDQGFTAFPTGGFIRAAYVAGRGWHHNYPTGDYSDRITAYKDTPGSVDVRITYMEADVESCTGVGSIGLLANWGAPYPGCSDLKAFTSGSCLAHNVTFDGVVTAADDPYITKLIVRGLGVDPWA